MSLRTYYDVAINANKEYFIIKLKLSQPPSFGARFDTLQKIETVLRTHPVPYATQKLFFRMSEWALRHYFCKEVFELRGKIHHFLFPSEFLAELPSELRLSILRGLSIRDLAFVRRVSHSGDRWASQVTCERARQFGFPVKSYAAARKCLAGLFAETRSLAVRGFLDGYVVAQTYQVKNHRMSTFWNRATDYLSYYIPLRRTTNQETSIVLKGFDPEQTLSNLHFMSREDRITFLSRIYVISDLNYFIKSLILKQLQQ